MRTKIGQCVQAAPLIVAALFILVASASAATVTFNTTATGSAGTGFNSSGNLSLSQSSGVAATLGFVADPNVSVGIPSGINFGNFTLRVRVARLFRAAWGRPSALSRLTW